jgi:hypothetical protein
VYFTSLFRPFDCNNRKKRRQHPDILPFVFFNCYANRIPAIGKLPENPGTGDLFEIWEKMKDFMHEFG